MAGQTRILAVVDRMSPDVARGCESSFQFLKAFLNDAAKDHLDQNGKRLLQIYEWPAEVVPTPGDILNYYRSADFAADDILWFYYCGHGATDQKGGHFLRTSQGDLLRSELRKVMESRRTKAVILTTDACSSPAKFVYNGPTASGGPPVEIDHWAKLQKILSNTYGTVDFTAASGTDRAFVDSELGANFTRALAATLMLTPEQMDLDGDKTVTWPEIFALVRNQTRYYFTSMVRRVSMEAKENYLKPEDKDQIPFAFSLGAPPPVAEGTSINSSAKVFYILQSPYSWNGNEQGTRFVFKTQFASQYEGRTVQFQMSFWNAQGQQIPILPGSRYFHYFELKMQKNQLGENDNRPWEIFINDKSVPIKLDANGDEEPIQAKLTIYDVTDRPNYKVILDQNFKMVNRTRAFGLGPRR